MELAVYLHFPFCAKHCPYCDFVVIQGRDSGDYVEYLEKDLRIGLEALRAVRDGDALQCASTVYFGGGTPSLMPEGAITRLLDIISRTPHLRLPLQGGGKNAGADGMGTGAPTEGASPSVEITLEANSEDITSGSLRSWKSQGITRLSVGVQSFQDNFLRALGRVHFTEGVKRACALALDAGFDTVNFDLIYGKPGEALADWERDLDALLEFDPPHVSLYALELSPQGYARMKRISASSQLELEDSAVVAMYRTARERLQAAGHRWYEVSNYAKPGHESRHNIAYWRGVPYLGVGLGAHSFINGERFERHRNLALYKAALDRGEIPYAIGYDLSTGRAAFEQIIARFRYREEFDPGALVHSQLGRPLKDIGALNHPLEATVERLKARRQLEGANGRVRLSDEALEISNAVLSEFLELTE
ncbi:MAG: coproporphyrinogen-III oxidase family protein [bacterium]